MPAVVDAIAPIPVVAAGGIADGRGLAAVLALGAAGAFIGTRFLASEEIAIHPRYQEHLLRATENDTIYLEDREGEVIARSQTWGSIVCYQSYVSRSDTEGDIDALPFYVEQSVGLLKKVQPAGEIVREIASEAQAVLRRLVS